MPLLTTDFRIHWWHMSPYKSSTWTVELQKVCRSCRTKWIWEMLGDMNQLTLPRLGGWVWLKIERMTLLFKVLKLPDTSCVELDHNWKSCWFTDVITNLDVTKGIHYWNLNRITRLYDKAIWCRLVHSASFVVVAFHANAAGLLILRDIISPI